MNIKITKELLKNYRKYKNEIPYLEQELRELQTTDAGIGSSVILDGSTGYPRPQSIVGFDLELYDHRKKTLDKRKAQVRKVGDWIESIEDVEIRSVFRMRYINGMNWVKIAEKIGRGGNGEYVRRHIRDKYLEKCKIK